MAMNPERVSISEAAQHLGVAPSMLERWVRQGLVASHHTGGQVWFDPAELRTWAKTHGVQSRVGARQKGLFVEDFFARAIERGAVIPSADATSVLGVIELATRALVDHQVIPEEQLTGFTEQVIERERMASTALGSGVAVPHPREPQQGLVAEPVVVVVFPKVPVDWAALDGRDVHAAFLLLSPNAREHLQVLSRLAFAMRSDGFAEWLMERPSRAQLAAKLRTIVPEV